MLKVIIVEKDTNFSNNIHEILNLHKFDIREVNRIDAVEAEIVEFMPDLLIVSVNWDFKSSGIDLVKKFRKGYNIPVLLINDFYTQVDDSIDLSKISNSEAINKPFKTRDFLAAIDRLLNKK
ncbi:response regulator transcription factor [Echinicola sp. CAU 1574]|uniref:Response regulator transcription factor n=1 Tax=Echinicola arenosa TaxID=2774144 RepID=A0ABR9AKJ0_9BACT|nr:response regulator [Echinicola arenosa]MBD8489345.1 response regulator transcription factor [Echinicola arenosa]